MAIQIGLDLGERRRQRKLGELGQQYLGGDTSVLSQIGATDPTRAFELQKLQEVQRQKDFQDLQRGSKLAETILEADPEQRPEVYRATMEVAKKYGIDTSELPEFYTPETDQYLQRVIDVASSFEDSRKFGKVPEGYVFDPKTEEARRFKGLPAEEKERKIIKDAQGRQRYADTKELVFPDVKGAEKKLTGTQAKTFGITSGGLEDIKDMRTLIADFGGKVPTTTAVGGLIGGVISKPKVRQLRTLKTNLSDKIGRLRSGGAINKDEEKRFKSLLPTIADDSETIEFKLNKIEKEFNAVQEGITGEKNIKEQKKPQITSEQAIEELRRRGKL